MTKRVTTKDLNVALYTLCASDGVPFSCCYDVAGEWLPVEQREPGMLMIDNTPVYGGAQVQVRTPGGGEGDFHLIGSSRRPARELLTILVAMKNMAGAMNGTQVSV